MSNQTKNAPVATHRDGAISSKVWRNVSNEGKPYYSVTFARTYTNPQTQQISEAQSFSGTDILKVQQLASESYNSISVMRAQDKQHTQAQAQAQTQAPQQQAEPPLPNTNEPQGLEAQRDIAMADAEPDLVQADRVQAPVQAPTYEQ